MAKKKKEDAPVTPPTTGGNSYRRSVGKVGIVLSATPEERMLLRQAAAATPGMSMAGYTLAAAVAQARKDLGKDKT